MRLDVSEEPVKEVTFGLDTGTLPRDYLGRSSISQHGLLLLNERERRLEVLRNARGWTERQLVRTRRTLGNIWKMPDLTKGSSKGERVSTKQFIAHGQGS